MGCWAIRIDEIDGPVGRPEGASLEASGAAGIMIRQSHVAPLGVSQKVTFHTRALADQTKRDADQSELPALIAAPNEPTRPFTLRAEMPAGGMPGLSRLRSLSAVPAVHESSEVAKSYDGSRQRADPVQFE